MADKLKTLYDLISSPERKLYTKSYDEFVTQFSDPDKRGKLHSLLQTEQVYTKGLDEFNTQFFAEVDLKKKDDSESSGEGSQTSSASKSELKLEEKPVFKPNPLDDVPYFLRKDVQEQQSFSFTRNILDRENAKQEFFKNTTEHYGNKLREQNLTAKDYVTGEQIPTATDSPLPTTVTIPPDLSEALVNYQADLDKRRNSFGMVDVYKPTSEAIFHDALATAFDNSYKSFFAAKRYGVSAPENVSELKLFDHNGKEITAEEASSLYPGVLENPNYFGGTARSFWQDFMAPLRQSVADFTHVVERIPLAPYLALMPKDKRQAVLDVPTAGDIFEGEAEEARGQALKYAPLPPSVLGNAIQTTMSMAELGTELALTRRGLGLNHIQSLFTQMMGKGYVAGALRPEDYGMDNSLLGSLKGAGVGFEEAGLLASLGYTSNFFAGAAANKFVKNNAQKLLQTELKQKAQDVATVAATGSSMVGFGAISAFNQWRYTGEVDIRKVGGDMLSAGGLTTMGILPKQIERAHVNYFSADAETKNFLRSNLENPEALRTEQLRLATEAKKAKTSAVAFNLEAQAEQLGMIADVKAMDDLVGKNYNLYLRAIEKADLPPEAKEAMTVQIYESKFMENNSFEASQMMADQMVAKKRLFQITRIENNLEKDGEAKTMSEYDIEKQQLTNKISELDKQIKIAQETQNTEFGVNDFMQFESTAEIDANLNHPRHGMYFAKTELENAIKQESFDPSLITASKAQDVLRGVPSKAIKTVDEAKELLKEVDDYIKTAETEVELRKTNNTTEGEQGKYVFGQKAYNDVRAFRLDLRRMPDDKLEVPSTFTNNIIPEFEKEIKRREELKGRKATAQPRKTTISPETDQTTAQGEEGENKPINEPFTPNPELEKKVVELNDKMVQAQAETKKQKEKAQKTTGQQLTEQIVNPDEYLKQQFLKEGVKKRSVRQWLADRIVKQESPAGRHVVEGINLMKGASLASEKQIKRALGKIFGTGLQTMSQGEQLLVYDVANLKRMSEMQRITEDKNVAMRTEVDAKVQEAQTKRAEKLQQNIDRINTTRDKKIDVVNKKNITQVEKSARIDELNTLYDSYIEKAKTVSEESAQKLEDKAEVRKDKKTIVRKEEAGYTQETADYQAAAFEAKDPVVFNNMLKNRGLKDVDVARVLSAVKEFQQVFKEKSYEAMQNGLISEATLNSWLTDQPFYSPDRYYEHVKNNSSYFRKSAKPFKESDEGSVGAKLNDPVQILSDYVTRVNSAIAYNNAIKRIGEYADKTPNSQLVIRPEVSPDFYEKMRNKREDTFIEKTFKEPPNGWVNVEYKENGEKAVIQMPEKLAGELTSPTTSGIMLNTIKWATGTKLTVASATTYNPVFGMLTNNIIDPITQWFSGDAWHWALPIAMMQQTKGVATNIKEATRYQMTGKDKTGAVSSYMEKGGGMGGITTEGLIQNKFGKYSAVGQMFEKVNAILTAPAAISEATWRTALRDQYLDKYVSEYSKAAGEKPDPATLASLKESAVLAARSYLDFAEGGATTKAFNSIQPFLAASMNVTRSVLRSAQKDPLLFSAKIAQLAAAKTALTSWNMGHYVGNDEEKNRQRDAFLYDIPSNIRKANFIIMLPKSLRDKNNAEVYPYIKIPIDNMVAPLVGMAEEIYIRQTHDDKYNVWSAENMVDLLSVLQPYADASSPAPIGAAFLNYALNKNLYTFNDIWNRTSPAGKFTQNLSKEYTPNTPSGYVKWGEMTGMSPERTKVAMGNLIAVNNSFAHVLGGLMKADVGNITAENWLEQAKKHSAGVNKLIGLTYPGANEREVDRRKQSEAALDVNAVKTSLTKMINDGADFSTPALHDLIYNFATTEDMDGNPSTNYDVYEKLMTYASEKVGKTIGVKIPGELVNFLYTTPETKAKMWVRYTENDPQRASEFMQGAVKIGWWDNATLQAYGELLRQNAKEQLEYENSDKDNLINDNY